jgi:uncharacterized protein
MNKTRSTGGLAASLLLTLVLTFSSQGAEKIRLLLVAGGHDYQTNQFHQFFQNNPEVTFEAFTHPKAQPQLRPEAAARYDVLVLYDLWQNISEEGKADLRAFLKAGKGLVVLHHAVANYQKWPEYEQIIGGKYYLEKTTVNGVTKAQSTYKHDVDFTVHIADPDHPVTRGLKDFQIHDETYGLFDMGPESHLLLTTTEPTSARQIGWAKTYGPARVVFIQLGHDSQAWRNPNYAQLVSQAIRWVAKKD